MHIGFDTVNLKGEHFTSHVSKGDEVKAGELLCEFDIEAIKAADYPVTTPPSADSISADLEVQHGRRQALRVRLTTSTSASALPGLHIWVWEDGKFCGGGETVGCAIWGNSGGHA